jgi:hypothetical protein
VRDLGRIGLLGLLLEPIVVTSPADAAVEDALRWQPEDIKVVVQFADV